MNATRPNPSRALLLIDFQHDFLADDGRLPVARHQVEPVLDAARRAVDEARRHGDLVVTIGNEFRRGDVLGNMLRRRAAIAGTAGTAWDPRVRPEAALHLSKSAPSAFSNPALGRALDEHAVRTVAIAGLFAKGCVSATAGAALERGLAVEILADAVACSSDRSRARALRRLARRGAHIRTTEPAGAPAGPAS